MTKVSLKKIMVAGEKGWPHDLEGYWHQLTSRQTELFCNQYLSGIWPRERWGDFANLLTYLRLTLQVVYPCCGLAKICGALSYFYDHKEEVDQQLAENSLSAQEARE